MDDLKNFILLNINREESTKHSKYKAGISNTHLLRTDHKNPLILLRTLVILYRCLEEEESYSLKAQILSLIESTPLCVLEKVNILMWVNKHRRAAVLLEEWKAKNNILSELVGVEAEHLLYSKIVNSVLAVKVESSKEEQCLCKGGDMCGAWNGSMNDVKGDTCITNTLHNGSINTFNNDTSNTPHVPHADGNSRLRFIDFKLTPLTIKEQLTLISELEIILKTNESYKAQAYLDRLTYENNKYNLLIRNIINFYQDSYLLLENMKNIEWSDYLFVVPFRFSYEVKKKLGRLLMKSFLYESGLKVFKEIGDLDGMIGCYVGMNKEEEAINELENKAKILHSNIYCSEKYDVLFEEGRYNSNANFSELQGVLNPAYRYDDRVALCEVLCLLGDLKNNTFYYDKAFEINRSAIPKHKKALHFFKEQQYELAKECLEQAQHVVPYNDRVLFTYACVLMKMKDYLGAVKVFEEISLRDDENLCALMNAAGCYLLLGMKNESFEFMKRGMKMGAKVAEEVVHMAMDLEKYEDVILGLGCMEYKEEVLMRVVDEIILRRVNERVLSLFYTYLINLKGDSKGDSVRIKLMVYKIMKAMGHSELGRVLKGVFDMSLVTENFNVCCYAVCEMEDDNFKDARSSFLVKFKRYENEKEYQRILNRT